jgi:hypothetical protein
MTVASEISGGAPRKRSPASPVPSGRRMRLGRIGGAAMPKIGRPWPKNAEPPLGAGWNDPSSLPKTNFSESSSWWTATTAAWERSGKLRPGVSHCAGT